MDILKEILEENYFKRNLLKAIIFDCDGILVDTEYSKFLAWQKALASIDIELSLEEYKFLAGHSSTKILGILQKSKHLSIPDKIIDLKDEEYKTKHAEGVIPISKTVEFARHLSKNKNSLGIKLGLASSASRSEIDANLKHIGLENAFDIIISGTDDLDSYIDKDGKNKPKPYIYFIYAKVAC